MKCRIKYEFPAHKLKGAFVKHLIPIARRGAALIHYRYLFAGVPVRGGALLTAQEQQHVRPGEAPQGAAPSFLLQGDRSPMIQTTSECVR